MENIKLRKALLAGTAVLALGAFATEANAAAVEIGNDVAVVNGVGISNADNIVDAVNDAGDELDVDLDGSNLTLGTDNTTAGIDGTGAGEADASLLYFTNTSTTASTVTVQDNGAGNAIITDGAAADLIIALGTDDTTAATAATNMIVAGNVLATGGGTISFALDGFDGNTLTFLGNVDLDGGATTMNDATDVVRFNGATAQSYDGDLDGPGIVNIDQSTSFVTAIGANADLGSITIAAGKVASFAANVTTNETGDDFVLEGADSEINVTAGATLVGNITTAANGAGILDIDADTTVQGSVGSATKGLEIIELAADTTLTFDAVTADIVVNSVGGIEISDATDNDGLIFATNGNDIVVYNAITTLTADTGDITIEDAGTVTFEADLGTSTKKIEDLNVGDGAANVSVTTKGNVYANDIVITDESTLTTTGVGKVVSGTVDGGGGGEGNLVVGNGTDAASVTFQSAVGTTDLDLIQVAANATGTFQNVVEATTGGAGVAGLDVDGTLILDSNTTGANVTIATGDIDSDGTVRIIGDNATSLTAASDAFFDGVFDTRLTGGVETTVTATAGDIGFGTAANTTINIRNGLNLAVGDEVLIGDDVPAAGGDGFDVRLNIFQTADFDITANDVIDMTGEFNFDGDSRLIITIAEATAELDDGDTITIVDGNTAPDLNGGASTFGALLTAGNIVLNDTIFLDIENNTAVTDVGAGDFGVTVSINDADDVLGSTYGKGAANAILAINSANTTGNLETARGRLQGAATVEAAENVAESIAPEVAGGATVGVTTNVLNSSLGLQTQRLASIRTGEGTGMGSGYDYAGMNVWGQVFGTSGDQDERDGVAGYDVDTVGVTVGIDTEALSPWGVLGLALTYANSDLESDSVNSTDSDIDTWQVALYGDYDLGRPDLFLNGMVGYAHNSIDQTRYNVGTIAGVNADADYSSDAWFARANLGHDVYMNNGLTLTPSALANLVFLDTDDYTESGAGTLNLDVDTDNQVIFELGVGLDAAWDVQLDDGSVMQPSLHAGYRYDLVGDEVESTATFTGGGAAFNTDGYDAQRSTFDVGAGVSFFTTNNWEVTADYTYEIKEDYDAHNGFLRAAYSF